MTMPHTIILGSGVVIGVWLQPLPLTPENRKRILGLAKLNALQRLPPAAHHFLDKFLDNAYRTGCYGEVRPVTIFLILRGFSPSGLQRDTARRRLISVRSAVRIGPGPSRIGGRIAMVGDAAAVRSILCSRLGRFFVSILYGSSLGGSHPSRWTPKPSGV